MKNIFLTLALLLTVSFAFANVSSVDTNNSNTESSGYQNTKVVDLYIDPGCFKYGKKAAYAEEAAYGTMGTAEWAYTAILYYDACVDAGGVNNVLDPVFL